jgi:hypothetical protein
MNEPQLTYPDSDLASSGNLVRAAQRKSLGLALGISALFALVLLFSRETVSNEARTPQNYGLQGTWINTVNPILPPGVPPLSFTSYITVSAGGGCISSDRTRPFSGPQHGSWIHLGGHEFAMTFIQDAFDAAGIFQGVFKVRTRVELTGKDEYSGVANVEQQDPQGNLVFSRCARIHGVRLAVERLQPPCEGLEI